MSAGVEEVVDALCSTTLRLVAAGLGVFLTALQWVMTAVRSPPTNERLFTTTQGSLSTTPQPSTTTLHLMPT